MGLLLDTHVVLWWLGGDPRLPSDAKIRIEDEPDVHVSPISVWEVLIKQTKGKLTAPDDVAESIRGQFGELPVTVEHAIVAGRLPPIHRDPFDRMLVVQAKYEGLTLVTHDPLVQKYDVDLLAI